MNRIYTPDKWLLVMVTHPDYESIIKVMGSWYGGFTQGDSWRLSSGVVRIEKRDDGLIDFHNHSGSIYRVHKDSEGASMYTEGALANLGEGLPDVKIERITLDDAYVRVMENGFG